ncbi:MAG TPA: hypothetical protein VE987_15685 [Polyangiaceae bacterium]|nr:hypothetical protein [Polyangiaceae bacterium]
MICAICSEREAEPKRCTFLGAPPMCQLCHANRRLVLRCSCMTTEQAIAISGHETEPDARKLAMAKIREALR